MPTLHIHSNIPQDDLSLGQFTGKATELLSKTLGKNTSYIQVIYTRSMIIFGNQAGPSALVELRSVGLTHAQADSLVAPLSRLVERYLGAPPPTTYLHFHPLDRSLCAWNGRPLENPTR
jgi:phenylpyruvate tautomerase PptA (4-oxalocrotonate tautomerase family)